MKLQENIETIIEWIEENKYAPLRIDEIAQHAGYSKWYLQRAFYQVTGVTLAVYCRRRRLSLAALAVKYSSMTLAEIASWYQYDSQQTFNKEFLRNFGTTPGKTRKEKGLNAKYIYPSQSAAHSSLLADIKICTTPVVTLYGAEKFYPIEPCHLDRHPVAQRKKIWDDFLSTLTEKPEKIYCLTGPSDIQSEDFKVRYRYFPAVDSMSGIGMEDEQLKTVELCNTTLYASFAYRGHYSGVENFIRDIYNRQIPRAELHRADGDDIEEFVLNGRAAFGDQKGNVDLTYYVPVTAYNLCVKHESESTKI